MRRDRLLAALLFLAFIFRPTFSARSSDLPPFYDQLRQRNLFGLVESDCLRRLEAPSLSEAQRGELILELSKTYAAHAWHTAGSEQDDLWQRASRIIVELLARPTATPRRELFETQLALIELGRAEVALASLELQPDDSKRRQQGRKFVEAAIEQFTLLEKTLSQQVRQSSAETAAKSASEGRLTPYERRTLWQQLRFRLGIARLTEAKLAADVPADRATALLAADEWLMPLAQGASHERLTWDSQLALAEVARLRGDLDRATKALTAFEKTIADDTPLELRERLVIERLRGMLAARKPTDAVSWLIEQRRDGVLKSAASGSPELAYWQIVAELSLWRLASDKQDAKLAEGLWNRVTAEVERLGHDEGGYWSARAKLEWQRELDVQQLGSELAELVRKARNGFSTLPLDEALRRFDAAIAAAQKRSPKPETTALLLELRDSRATLLFQAKRFDDAAAAFRELAEAPRHDRSAATHLLWAFCLGKQFESEPTDSRRVEFVAALRSLRERNPVTTEASEAAWLLGLTLERQQQFLEAMELFVAVPESHARHDEAWAGIARCHEQQIARLRREGKPTDELHATAIRQLQTTATAIIQASGAASDSRPKDDDANRRGADAAPLALNAAQSELLVRLARLLLERQPSDDKAADRLLEFVIARSVDREWLKLAKQLRVVSLAGQRRIDEAERLIGSLEAAGPDESLTLLDGLSAVAARSDLGTQRLVADLQLRASESLNDAAAKLTDSQRLRLLRARAEAFAATGQPTKAIGVYQQLVEKSPRDPKLVRTAAELCESLDTKEGTQQAKSHWRRLEGLLKAGSLEWLDARWHVIRCCQKLGEKAEADKLLKVTKLLYPDLGGEAMRARFEELSRR